MLGKTSRYFFVQYTTHTLYHILLSCRIFIELVFLAINVWCFDVASTRPGGGVAAERCRQVYISTQFVKKSPLFTHKWAIILLFGYKLSYIGYSKPASLLFLNKIVYIIVFLNRQLEMWHHSGRYFIDKPLLRAINNTCS